MVIELTIGLINYMDSPSSFDPSKNLLLCDIGLTAAQNTIYQSYAGRKLTCTFLKLLSSMKSVYPPEGNNDYSELWVDDKG